MRQVPIKKLKEENGPELDYIEILRMLVRVPEDPRAGIGIEEIRKALRILDVLDGGTKDGHVLLEDADYQYLAARVKAHKWPMATREIVEFYDDVVNAKEPAKG